MKAAVICSKGIGDTLMMLVASYNLYKKGYRVTTFQHSSNQLDPYFPYQTFDTQNSLVTPEKTLSTYDLLVLQNDNSPLSSKIIDLYRQGKLPPLSVFYPSYSPSKHPPLTPLDHLFDQSCSMVENIAQGIGILLQSSSPKKGNGLVVPDGLIQTKYENRILIHPTSTPPKSTWSPSQFLKVAKELRKRGFEVAFCVSPAERKRWVQIIQKEFLLPLFPSLKDLVPYVYQSRLLIGNDSGPGHLASNLNLPTLIVASSHKHIALWRPGWFPGKVITPSPLIPNIKGGRLREKKWYLFIRSKKVLETTYTLLKKEPRL